MLVKVTVKCKSPSNETQPETSLDLDQQKPSSYPTSCFTGQSKHSTFPSAKVTECVYPYCCSQEMPYRLARYKKGRKLQTIKTWCQPRGDDKNSQPQVTKRSKKRIIITIIIAAITNWAYISLNIYIYKYNYIYVHIYINILTTTPKEEILFQFHMWGTWQVMHLGSSRWKTAQKQTQGWL